MSVVFRNHKALFLWGFAAVFMTFVGLMTWVLIRDGAPAGYSLPFMVAVFAVFWLAGLALVGYVAQAPCIEVRARSHADIVIRWRYPLRRVERRLLRRDATPARMVEGKDSDGDPYFHAQIDLPDGTTVDLWEGHDRDHAEAVCARYNQALGLSAPGG